MKKIFLLILFFQLFPYIIYTILLLHGNIDRYKLYHKICHNFDNTKFIDPKIKSKGDYLLFMAEHFYFEESRSISLLMRIGFNVYLNFGIILILFLLYCLSHYNCNKCFEFIIFVLCFLGLCLSTFFGRDLYSYVKLYKGGLIFEDDNLNKEFLSLVHYYSFPKILGILIEYSSLIDIILLCLFKYKYK